MASDPLIPTHAAEPPPAAEAIDFDARLDPAAAARHTVTDARTGEVIPGVFCAIQHRGGPYHTVGRYRLSPDGRLFVANGRPLEVWECRDIAVEVLDAAQAAPPRLFLPQGAELPPDLRSR